MHVLRKKTLGIIKNVKSKKVTKIKKTFKKLFTFMIHSYLTEGRRLSA